MEPETNQQKVYSGQVTFTEYSYWKKGQCFISVTHTMPESKEKTFMGRVFLELDENKKATYVSKDPQGNELFPPSKNLIELKNQFKDMGKKLDLMEQEKGRGQNTTPEVEETEESEESEETESEETEESEEESEEIEGEDKEQEIKILRNDKEKNKGKGKTR